MELLKPNNLNDEDLLPVENVIRLEGYRASADRMPPQWGIPEGRRGIGGEHPRPGKVPLLEDRERLDEIKAAFPGIAERDGVRLLDWWAIFGALCDAIEQATGTPPIFTHGDLWVYDCRLGHWRRTNEAERYTLYRLLHFIWLPLFDERKSPAPITMVPDSLTKIDRMRSRYLPIYKAEGFADELPGLIMETNLEPERGDPNKSIKQALIWEPRNDGLIHYHPPAASHLKRNAHWDPDLGVGQVVHVSDGPPDCEKWDRYLRSIWGEVNNEEYEIKKECLEAFLGACLAGIACQFQQMLIFIGTGSNGKSILLEFIEQHLFRPGEACALPPNEWVGFMKAQLDGPLINLVPELDERSVFANAAFKSALAGEPLTTDVKHHGAYKFRPRCGHIFSANRMPIMTDTTIGFKRRFIMLSFNKNFEADPRRREPPEILADLGTVAPTVRARCLWACAAALKEKSYPIPIEHHALMDVWETRSNPVRQFIDNVTTEGDRAEQSEVYRAYADFCEAVGNKKMSSRRFYEEMELAGHRRTAPSSSKRRWFNGIAIKAQQDWGDGAARG